MQKCQRKQKKLFKNVSLNLSVLSRASKFTRPLHPFLVDQSSFRACDRCGAEKRKTINGEDVLYSLGALGFDNYMEVLRVYLQQYRKSLTGVKTKKRSRQGEPREDEGAAR